MNNQNLNMGANATKEEYVPMRIEVETIPFDGLLKSKLTTTIEMAKLINAIFKGTIVDYEGCIVAPDVHGQLQVALYFKDKGNAGKDMIKAVSPVAKMGRGATGIERIQNINARYSSKKYDLTKDIKEILSEFIYAKNGNINWNQHVFEQSEQSYNSYQVYVKVIGLDLLKLIKKIYGGKVDKHRVDYNVSIVRPVGLDMNGFSQNFLVNIQQLDSREVENLANSLGLLPVQGSINMVR
jgi:hypothetical protein